MLTCVLCGAQSLLARLRHRDHFQLGYDKPSLPMVRTDKEWVITFSDNDSVHHIGTVTRLSRKRPPNACLTDSSQRIRVHRRKQSAMHWAGGTSHHIIDHSDCGTGIMACVAALGESVWPHRE